MAGVNNIGVFSNSGSNKFSSMSLENLDKEILSTKNTLSDLEKMNLPTVFNFVFDKKIQASYEDNLKELQKEKANREEYAGKFGENSSVSYEVYSQHKELKTSVASREKEPARNVMGISFPNLGLEAARNELAALEKQYPALVNTKSAQKSTDVRPSNSTVPDNKTSRSPVYTSVKNAFEGLTTYQKKSEDKDLDLNQANISARSNSPAKS
jgi:hypothetical protein